MIHFMTVCHPPDRCVDRFSGLAVADLESRLVSMLMRE
jgi:hypothetical protein